MTGGSLSFVFPLLGLAMDKEISFLLQEKALFIVFAHSRNDVDDKFPRNLMLGSMLRAVALESMAKVLERGKQCVCNVAETIDAGKIKKKSCVLVINFLLFFVLKILWKNN